MNQTSLADRLLASLSRVTSGGRLIPEVDGLRFIAISSVLVAHILHYIALIRPGLYGRAIDVDSDPSLLVRCLANGKIGVCLFFAISGFILATPFARHALKGGPPVGLRAYLLRRLTRLEPPYLLSMVLLAALLVCFSSTGFTPARAAKSFLASAAYSHSLIFERASDINFVAWSLEIEVQFYLLVPMLARAYEIKSPLLRRGAIVGAMLALFALQQTSLQTSTRFLFSILNYGQYFLAGFLLADWFVVDMNEELRPAVWGDFVWAAGWVAIYLVVDWRVAPGLLVPLLLAAVFAAGLRGRLARRLLASPWIMTIGGMCYSIYLLHIAAISAVGRFTMRLATGHLLVDLLAQTLLIGAPTVAISAVFFVLVERPCMRRDWPQRLWAAVSQRAGRASTQALVARERSE